MHFDPSFLRPRQCLLQTWHLAIQAKKYKGLLSIQPWLIDRFDLAIHTPKHLSRPIYEGSLIADNNKNNWNLLPFRQWMKTHLHLLVVLWSASTSQVAMQTQTGSSQAVGSIQAMAMTAGSDSASKSSSRSMFKRNPSPSSFWIISWSHHHSDLQG